MINYKLTNGNIVIKIEGVFPIPIQSGDEGLNSNWDEYQEWLKDGNKPLPADIVSVWDTPRDLMAEMEIMKVDIVKLKAGKIDKV